MLERLDADDAEHFAAVRRLLEQAGIAYELDGTLVRGLDYYTRTVFAFECERLGAQSEVGGGGRYDRLIEELDGPPTPAAGWAAGVERILLALGEEHEPLPHDVFVAAEDGQRERALALVTELRHAGLRAELDLADRGLKGQMRHADRLGAAHAVILDDAAARSSATCAPASSGRSTSRGWSRSSPGGERAWLPAPGSAAERLPRRLVRTGPRGPGRVHGPGRGLGAQAARPRRARLRRPARPDGHRAARLQPGHSRRCLRARPPSCAPRTSSASPARWCGAPPRRSIPSCRRASSRSGSPRRRCWRMPRRRRSRSRASRERWGRRCGFATATSTCAASGCSEAIELRHDGHAGDSGVHERRGLPRDRDAGADPLHARGGARLPGPQPPATGLLLRAAPVATAVQAAPDDRRIRALLPDRALLSRRGPARRSPAGLHPARRRDVVRGSGGRPRPQRAPAGAGARAGSGSRWRCRSRGFPTTTRSRATGPTSPTRATGSSSAI